MIARAISPDASGDSSKLQVLRPPAETPKTVTLSGDPPKLSMLRLRRSGTATGGWGGWGGEVSGTLCFAHAVGWCWEKEGPPIDRARPNTAGLERLKTCECCRLHFGPFRSIWSISVSWFEGRSRAVSAVRGVPARRL